MACHPQPVERHGPRVVEVAGDDHVVEQAAHRAEHLLHLLVGAGGEHEHAGRMAGYGAAAGSWWRVGVWSGRGGWAGRGFDGGCRGHEKPWLVFGCVAGTRAGADDSPSPLGQMESHPPYGVRQIAPPPGANRPTADRPWKIRDDWPNLEKRDFIAVLARFFPVRGSKAEFSRPVWHGVCISFPARRVISAPQSRQRG